MPFTIAHPAVVLPLSKSKWFSLTALVAGSIVPDFEFFFQMREVENIGHHWYGIILFDFPVGLIFCFLFHNLLRNALVANLPVAFRNRFSSAVTFNWNKYAEANKTRIALSILTGIASHILWDGFTHHDGMFVQLIPALSAKSALYAIPVYFLLQVMFSILGMMTVMMSIIKMPVQTNNVINIEPNIFYWPLFSMVLAAILLIRLTIWPEYNSFWGVFMAVMGAICYTWLLVSVFIQNYLPKNISL
jgi:hypothetical protein